MRFIKEVMFLNYVNYIGDLDYVKIIGTYISWWRNDNK